MFAKEVLKQNIDLANVKPFAENCLHSDRTSIPELAIRRAGAKPCGDFF
jgi:hypothetical protein